jgi:hypothetical protein
VSNQPVGHLRRLRDDDCAGDDGVDTAESCEVVSSVP